MLFLDDSLSGDWHGRWNHVAVRADELPLDCDAAGRKNALRDRLAHGFNGEPDDIVMHGNIDEIPAGWMAVRLARGESELPVTLRMRHCCGHAGVVLPGQWDGTAAHQRQHVGSFSGLRRRRKEFPAVINAGTRLSAMGIAYTEGVSWQKEIDDSWPRYIREALCPGEWWQDQGECEPRQQLLQENIRLPALPSSGDLVGSRHHPCLLHRVHGADHLVRGIRGEPVSA